MRSKLARCGQYVRADPGEIDGTPTTVIQIEHGRAGQKPAHRPIGGTQDLQTGYDPRHQIHEALSLGDEGHSTDDGIVAPEDGCEI